MYIETQSQYDTKKNFVKPWESGFPLTLRAYSRDVKLMAVADKSVPFGYVLFHLINPLVRYLNDPAAMVAAKMTMMVPAVHVFVMHVSVFQVNFRD